MNTRKVGRAAPVASKSASVQKAGASAKVSFAETLAAKRASGTKDSAEKSSEDPRKKEVMDKLAQGLLGSALGVAKERKMDREKASGGLEGDE